MQEELVQEITKLVVQELKKQPEKEVPSSVGMSVNKEAKVSLYGKRPQSIVAADTQPKEPMISLYNTSSTSETSASEKVGEKSDVVSLKVTKDSEKDRLIEEDGEYLNYTPARVAVGRSGSRPRTSTLLKFRFDHAAAVDAVFGEVSQELLDRLDLFTVETMIEDKEAYIRRPDLGRKLSTSSRERIKKKCKYAPTVQIIASNGLSASAVNANLEDVYLSLKQSLANLKIQMGTPFYAHQGRVGLMDDVGDVLEPEIVVNLIGERPGLVSAESLSAYICYQPGRETIESDRMVVSNIHRGGIPPIEAGSYLGTVIERMLKHKASGVKLIQKEG